MTVNTLLSPPPSVDHWSREDRLASFPGDEGEAMTHSEMQGDAITYVCQSLQRLAEHQNIPWLVRYEAFLFYSQQNPSLQVGPDILLAKGVELPGDVHYRLWESGIPDLILEVASASTWREDSGWKKELYQTMQVPEYWQYDPQGHLLQDAAGYFATPRLQGWTLQDEVYHPLPYKVKSGIVQMYSPVLGTSWILSPGDGGSELRLWDPRTHTWYRTAAEEAATRQQAEDRAARAEDRAAKAEDRAARAEAEARRLRTLLENQK